MKEQKTSAIFKYTVQAMKNLNQTNMHPIRGGTDGSRLSFMGLPTPNIFAGEHSFHSQLEWVAIQDMEMAVKVIVEIAKIWEKRS
jgi:tripeptide aminopeptidase